MSLAEQLFLDLGYAKSVCKNGNIIYSYLATKRNRCDVEFFVKSQTYHLIGTRRFSVSLQLNNAIQEQLKELGLV